MRSAAVLAVALLVVCVLPAHAEILEACVNNGNGMMRLVDSTTLCHANETRVQWNQTGPAGPAGPPGPAGSTGGAPFVYVCTPVNFHNAGTTTDYLFIFNGSASAANLAINFLSKDGTNLSGQPIAVSPGTIPPGDPAPLYPGQTGASTVPLGAANTMFLKWYTAQGDLTTAAADVAVTVRITSDQPIVATQNMMWSGFLIAPCALLPK